MTPDSDHPTDPDHLTGDAFEDAPFGIEAARRAGMRAVAVCTTHTPAELAGPHVVAAVRTYENLVLSDFLETFDAATA